MKLADGVEMLEIPVEVIGRQMIIYPVVIYDKDDVVLVDTGFPGPNGIARIREHAHKAGLPFERLNKVILTHQDMDHIGGLPELLMDSPRKVEVFAHVDEKPYIEGTERLIKFTPERMASFRTLPEDQQNRMKAMFENPPKAPVDTALSDGQELPFGGGIVVIHTPGHTPGHICLYLKKSKVLIAGDGLNIADGGLVGTNPEHSSDSNLAIASLKKLTKYDIETVACYHGGAYSENANQRIAELAGA